MLRWRSETFNHSRALAENKRPRKTTRKLTRTRRQQGTAERKLPPGKPKRGGRAERKTRKEKARKRQPKGTTKETRKTASSNPRPPSPKKPLHLQTVNLVTQIILFYGSGVTEKSNQLKLKLKPKGNGMAASIPGQVAGAKPRKKRGEKKRGKS